MLEEGREVWSGYVQIVVEMNGTGLGERNKVEMKKGQKSCECCEK